MTNREIGAFFSQVLHFRKLGYKLETGTSTGVVVFLLIYIKLVACIANRNESKRYSTDSITVCNRILRSSNNEDEVTTTLGEGSSDTATSCH